MLSLDVGGSEASVTNIVATRFIQAPSVRACNFPLACRTEVARLTTAGPQLHRIEGTSHRTSGRRCLQWIVTQCLGRTTTFTRINSKDLS
jgi:hypothetical protein